MCSMSNPNKHRLPLPLLLLIMSTFLPAIASEITNRFALGHTRLWRSFLGHQSIDQICPVRASSTMSGETSQPAATFSVAFVTVPDETVAKKIARGLVSAKLAACVNIIPQITSVYEWKGEIQEDAELLLKIKTRTAKIQELTAFVKKNHPYEVCEVIATPITAGNSEYLKWLGDIVKA